MSVTDETREMRRDLGRQLAALRQQAGFTQRRFAPLTGYSRSTLSHAELGLEHIPRDFWQRCEIALGAGTALTDRYNRIEAGSEEGAPIGTVQECPACHRPLIILLAEKPP